MGHPPAGPSTPPPPPRPGVDRPRTMAEAADEIGMSYDWLRAKVKARAVPCKRFGRSIVFFDADIEAIKDQHQETPKAVRGRAA